LKNSEAAKALFRMSAADVQLVMDELDDMALSDQDDDENDDDESGTEQEEEEED
jgi:hypothetical protein